jgi:hypothetical protein
MSNLRKQSCNFALNLTGCILTRFCDCKSLNSQNGGLKMFLPMLCLPLSTTSSLNAKLACPKVVIGLERTLESLWSRLELLLVNKMHITPLNLRLGVVRYPSRVESHGGYGHFCKRISCIDYCWCSICSVFWNILPTVTNYRNL